VKSGRRCIRVWGCLEWTWPSRNTAWKYERGRIQGHLTRCVLPTIEDQFGDDNYLYHHDNAPCHKSRYVRELFVGNKVPEMDWPAQSPGLNPIEHLWDELEHRLRSRPQRPTSLNTLATALQEERAAIPPETFRHLAEFELS
jgi:hypothetical protein